MDISKIIADYLIAHGYDGLCCDDCGCAIEDLWPCAEIDNLRECEPGYKTPGCSSQCDEGCDFHITPNKPATHGKEEECP